MKVINIITLSEFKNYELEDLNYNGKVYCYDEEIENEVIDKLESFNLGKSYRFEHVKDNNLFFIENCDLQDIDNDLSNLFGYGDLNGLVCIVSEDE